MRLPSQAAGYANAIAVDCADKGRLGSALGLFEKAEQTCNIDHHPTNAAYAGYNALHASAGATGELIYRLSGLLGVTVTPPIANCLYTALITDTGNFAYSNASGDTLRIAGALLDAGADGYGLNLRFYRTMRLAKLRLLGRAIDNLELHEAGRIGITSLSKAEMQACNAHTEDTEGIVDYVRDLESVEIAIFFKEYGPETWKASLRSKREADVGRIAAGQGGEMCIRDRDYRVQ